MTPDSSIAPVVRCTALSVSSPLRLREDTRNLDLPARVLTIRCVCVCLCALSRSYGKEMTIERRIRRTPGGTYRLLNEWGVSVSTKREDLDSMLDHFSINAANPLSIITQDIAKSFHGSECGFSSACIRITRKCIVDIHAHSGLRLEAWFVTRRG